MLCPRRKFLKVVRATAAFPVILRAQAITSLTQQKEFHMEIKRNVHNHPAKTPPNGSRHGAHRSTVPGKRCGSRVRRVPTPEDVRNPAR
jgi:hypothetical protein